MIMDWRTQFNNYAMSFHYIIIAAYREGQFPNWIDLRQAQLAALALPYTGLASATDLGDEHAPNHIHPRNKSVLGARLANVALHDNYGVDVVTHGPAYADIAWPLSRAGVQTVVMTFDSTRVENRGLRLRDTSDCIACCGKGSAVQALLASGAVVDARVVLYAEASVVLAVVDSANEVVGVGLNWVLYPECALYNAANLPHLPFNVTRP